MLRALIIASVVLLATWPARAESLVDLELVLAIDGSSSIDEAEFALQMEGYATAFRDPRVATALVSGPRRQIAVAVIIWADATVPKFETGWQVLASQADLDAFAGFMAGLERRVEGGTGIGAGIAAGIRMLDRNGIDAPRQVVDVSGDGRETPARETVVLIPAARAMALVRGVAINGLAITNEDAGLAAWYRDRVIAGPGAFVISVADFADFSEAITRKLVREIEWQPRLERALGSIPPLGCLAASARFVMLGQAERNPGTQDRNVRPCRIALGPRVKREE